MMRFLLYDRVIEAVKGDHMIAVKNVSLTEDYLPDGYAGRRLLSGPLLIESMAQVGAWLVHLTKDFRVSALMVIVDQAAIVRELPPGRSVRIEVRILSLTRRWAQLSCVAYDDADLVARIDRVSYVLRKIEDPHEIAAEENRFRYYSGWTLEQVRAASAKEAVL